MHSIEDVEVDGKVINEIYSEGTITYKLPQLPEPPVNGYRRFVSFDNPKHAAIVRFLGNNRWQKIRSGKNVNLNKFEPRDMYQAALFDTLIDKEVTLNICLGAAGCGKTTIALAAAIEANMTKEKGERRSIVLSKPTTMVGKGENFGAVPGDVSEKYEPFLGSYMTSMARVLGGDTKYTQVMLKSGTLKFQPIEYIRGCEFADTTFILDEAQNLSWHELKTVISRIGQNSKIIILGDLNQIDTKIPVSESGLYQLITSEAFCESKISSLVLLENQYRSDIAQLIAEVDEELTGDAQNYHGLKN